MSLTETGLFSRYLDINGDGTGTKEAVGNYSAGVEEFYIEPAATVSYRVHRLIISLEDTTGMQADEYGNLAAALTNGVSIQEKDGSGVITDFTDSLPIKTNAGWGALCYDVDVKSWGQTPTNEFLLARFSFDKFGEGLWLTGELGEYLTVVLNDDFTGLISHKFLAQGTIFTRS